jgi:hypothetical protein
MNILRATDGSRFSSDRKRIVSEESTASPSAATV